MIEIGIAHIVTDPRQLLAGPNRLSNCL